MISRATFVKIAPRLASLTPFWRLMVDHLECPDIGREYTDYHRVNGPAARRASVRRPPAGSSISPAHPAPTVPNRVRSLRSNGGDHERGTARDDVEEPRPRPHQERRARRPRRRRQDHAG